ncbi:hypothetical protein OG21DRAFT_1514901 [Imleria badia]|nr:hypothetical protein OG21DRAFT_1514901 [Imleria badia]
MNTSTSIINGNWRDASSSAEIHLEVQTMIGIHVPFTPPIAPEPVRAAAVPTRTPDAIEDFFWRDAPACYTREPTRSASIPRW